MKRLLTIWSVFDVIEFFARDFIGSCELLNAMKAHLRGTISTSVPDGPVSESEIFWVKNNLFALRSHLEAMELPMSVSQVDRIVELTLPSSDLNRLGLSLDLKNLQERIDDELKTRFFYVVTQEKMFRFYKRVKLPLGERMEMKAPSEIFGADVIAKFSSAEYDLMESVRCFVANRSTASVFHLMRVLEIGLTALGKVFNVSLAHTNWGPALDKIESDIREMHKDPAWKALPDYKEQQEFYAQAASHFGIMKDAWRNYTAHARGKHDETEADSILRGVTMFMQRISTRLHE